MRDEPKDINEIRQRLLEVALGRPDELGSGISAAGSIVRSAWRAADCQGLSGEDRYALMTWHLLQHAKRLEKMMLAEFSTMPVRMVTIPKEAQG